MVKQTNECVKLQCRRNLQMIPANMFFLPLQANCSPQNSQIYSSNVRGQWFCQSCTLFVNPGFQHTVHIQTSGFKKFFSKMLILWRKQLQRKRNLGNGPFPCGGGGGDLCTCSPRKFRNLGPTKWHFQYSRHEHH